MVEKRENKETGKGRDEKSNGEGVITVHVTSQYACPSHVLPKLT
jgi:hypothetical protein